MVDNFSPCHLLFNLLKMIHSSTTWIHSADPQSRPVAITIFSHAVRPSVWPYVQNIVKQNKHRVKIMTVTGGTVSLAERIIDDTHVLFFFIFNNSRQYWSKSFLKMSRCDFDKYDKNNCSSKTLPTPLLCICLIFFVPSSLLEALSHCF